MHSFSNEKSRPWFMKHPQRLPRTGQTSQCKVVRQGSAYMAWFRKLPAAIIRQKSAIIKNHALKPQNSCKYSSTFFFFFWLIKTICASPGPPLFPSQRHLHMGDAGKGFICETPQLLMQKCLPRNKTGFTYGREGAAGIILPSLILQMLFFFQGNKLLEENWRQVLHFLWE